MSRLPIMKCNEPFEELPQLAEAINIDKSRRVFYSAMPLRTMIYGGFI
jgi:hypothetical protein